MATPGFNPSSSNAHENAGALNTAKLRPSKKLRQRMRKRMLAEEAKNLQVDNEICKSLEESSKGGSDVSHLSPSGSSIIHPCLNIKNSDSNELQIQCNSNEDNESRHSSPPAFLDSNSNNLSLNYGTSKGSELNNQKVEDACAQGVMASVDKIKPKNSEHDHNELDDLREKMVLNSSSETGSLLNEKKFKQLFSYNDGPNMSANSDHSCISSLSSTRPLGNKADEWEKTFFKSKDDLHPFEFEQGLGQDMDTATPFRTADNSKILKPLDERSKSPDCVLNSNFDYPDYIHNKDEETSKPLSSNFEHSFALNRIDESKDDIVENGKEKESCLSKTEKLLKASVLNQSDMEENKTESLLELIHQEIAKNADHVADNGLLTFPKRAFYCSFNLTKLFLNRILAQV